MRHPLLSRFLSRSFFTQASVALALSLLASAAAAQTAKPRPETPERHDWRAKLLTNHSPRKGCFQAVFPSTTWKEVSCGTPNAKPEILRRPPRLIKPNDTEKQTGDYSITSNSPIHSVSGYLDEIENVTSVIGSNTGLPDRFSLQINTDTDLPGTQICAGSSNSGCRGWLQFAYQSSGLLLIQAWATGYGSSCPSRLGIHDDELPNCGTNTATFQLPSPPKFWDLADSGLTGQVSQDANGNVFDEVVFTVGEAAYKTNAAADIVGAYGNWKNTEFNVFGFGGRDDAIFNSGSLIFVWIAVQNDGDPLTCNPLGTGTTGESTNLTLAPNGCSDGISTNGVMSFAEGVAPVIQTYGPTSGSAAGGTLVTFTATSSTFTGTTNPVHQTTVVNGFANPIFMFGNARATVQSCSATTCTVYSPGGTGTVPVTVANAFAGDLQLGPSADPQPALTFTYVGPSGCALTLGGCPAGGGSQQYSVTCPTTVDFKLDGQFVQTGTVYLGQEMGANEAIGVSACIPGTSNCQIFATQATMSCPIHPPPPPPVVYPNCEVCSDRMQQCVPVPNGYVCKGPIQSPKPK